MIKIATDKTATSRKDIQNGEEIKPKKNYQVAGKKLWHAKVNRERNKTSKSELCACPMA